MNVAKRVCDRGCIWQLQMTTKQLQTKEQHIS